jgi:hypothetical protein
MSNAVSLFGVAKEEELFEPHIEPPHQYLSFKDLEGVIGFQTSKETQNKELFESIIWTYGADTTKPYIIRKVLHRPRTSKEVYDGFRVEFTERLDKEYLLSGMASIEAQLFTKDKSLAAELMSLDPRNAANKKKDFTEDSECSVEVYEDDCI